ncbi:MAG: calcium-binding protein [Nitrospira sp.]|nr:MAG: calcium-binding protein [Nitrospira sp.]
MAIINGTAFNDRLNGTAGDDTISGFGGDDILNGLDGNDDLFGGDGVDILNGGAGNDVLRGEAGADALYGDSGHDFLIGGVGDDSLYGGTGNDDLDGGNGNDFHDGGDGNDTLGGSSGADILLGGNGNDTYYVDADDVVDEISNDALGGVDLVIADVNYTLGFGLEHLILARTPALNGTGNALHNTITGNSVNNVLSGLDGDDVLSGRAGNDTLNGGAGVDHMDGGDGSDTYVVDHPLDVVIDLGPTSDIDTVQSSIGYTLGGTIERLTLTETGTFAINGTGNAQNNVITGNGYTNVLFGLQGDDQLFGRAGTDTLIGGFGNDLLNGGTGADSMNGGDGNDTYVVDHVSDVAAESFAEDGVDTVQASVTHTLNQAIEHLTLTGSSAINGTGNALNNTLTGNSANNILSGLNGNDRLTGGAGNDTLLGGNGNDVLTGGSGRDQLNGGAGSDRFDYNAVSESPTSTGRDVITGFAGAGTALGDQIDLRDIDANVSVAGNQAFTWKGATPGGAGTLWYTGGVLYGNVDGDATPEFQIQLVGSPALSVGGTGTDILL